MKFLTRFNHKRVVCPSDDMPSMTDPQYLNDCDVNVVVGRFLRGAGLDNVNVRKGSYGDVSRFEDFHSMMEVVNDGTKAFMEVPSEIRAKFGNDPRAFFDFATDPANADKLVEMGLASIFEPENDVVKVQVVNPTPAKEPPLQNT